MRVKEKFDVGRKVTKEESWENRININGSCVRDVQ